MTNARTPEEILKAVKRNRPPGWRWFNLNLARRVAVALEKRSPEIDTVGVGVIRTGGAPDFLAEHTVINLAEQVRTNNGAVGFGLGAAIGWLLWSLAERSVWWAIQWAWKQEMGLDD